MALRDVCLVAAFGGAAKMLKRASAGRCRQHSGNPSRRDPTCNTEPLAECQQLSQNWRADHSWELRKCSRSCSEVKGIYTNARRAHSMTSSFKGH